MIELIFKNNIDKSKIRVLLELLRSWNIEAEFKRTKLKPEKKEEIFSLATGIWEDYNIDSSELRKQAWKQNK